MYCNKCGSQNSETSKFCKECGSSLVTDISPTQPIHNEISNPNVLTSDLLWKKFVEIYDALDKDKEHYLAMTSVPIWELLNRLAHNTFESFILDNKDELNLQPYKTIDNLKKLYTWSVVGGYKLWLAEALLKNKELGKFKAITVDKMVNAWKDFDFSEGYKNIPDEVSNCISQYLNFRIDSYMDENPKAQEISMAVVDNLKTSIMFQIANGYIAGEIENRFRQ